MVGYDFKSTDYETIRQKIYNNIQVIAEGCWIWTKYVDRAGYAVIALPNAPGGVRAHRPSYEVFVGLIPDGLEIDHLCRNTRCINPTHLEPVQHIVNIRRSALVTGYCRKGHKLTTENTYRTNRGGRRCRRCQLDRNAESRQRYKERMGYV